MAPQDLNDKITCTDNVHKCTQILYDICQRLACKKTNTAYYARSFEISGTLAYNNLPDHIKQ